MTIDSLQQLVQRGQYAYYRHALIEADKEGVGPEEVVRVILTGEIIEEYQDRHRCLVYGLMSDGLPLHVVCDCGDNSIVWVVTVYIPQDTDWIGGKTRR